MLIEEYISVAKNLNYLGATVIGYGRKASFDAEGNNYVTEYYDKSNFSDFLRKCDYFINVLPSTIETQGLLNGTVLENCKGQYNYINIQRFHLSLLFQSPFLITLFGKALPTSPGS